MTLFCSEDSFLFLILLFAVIHAVSWEDWWTYDGISGKYLFRKLIYSKIMGLLWPACVQFEPNKQLRLMLSVHNIRTIRKYSSNCANNFSIPCNILPTYHFIVRISTANSKQSYEVLSALSVCSTFWPSEQSARLRLPTSIYSEQNGPIFKIISFGSYDEMLGGNGFKPFFIFFFNPQISYFNLCEQ